MYRKFTVLLALLLVLSLTSWAAESEPSNTVGFISFDCPGNSWIPFSFPFTYYDANHTVTYSISNIMVGNFWQGVGNSADQIWDQNNGLFAFKNASGAWIGQLTTITPGHAYWARIQAGHPQVTAITAGEVDMTTINLGTMANDPTVDKWTPVGVREPGVVTMANSCLLSSGFTGGFPSTNSDQLWDQNTGNYAWYNTNTNAWVPSTFTITPGHAYWVKVKVGHNSFPWNYTPSGQPGVNYVFEPIVPTPQQVPSDRVLRKVGTKIAENSGSEE